MYKRGISLLICIFMIASLSLSVGGFSVYATEDSFASVSTESVYSASSDYTGPYVNVGSVTLPLENHMPGTFFSRNGKACTCHYSTDCIANGSDCNCMRYYPTGNKDTCEIDLLAVQCFGFARLVFYKCFGFIDQAMNSSLYYSVGSLASGSVTATSVKNLLTKAAPGAHVRLSKGHSVSILTMDDDFIVIYHANAGGDGVASESCVVSTRRYTWQEFADSASAGIDYVNMPYNYPDSSIIPTEKKIGHYRITSDDGLRLRASSNTSSTILSVIPYNTIVNVTEIDGFWGKTTFDGKTGWIFLEYTVYYSAPRIAPSGKVIRTTEDGYLRAALWKVNQEEFLEYFDKQSLVVKNSSGDTLTSTEYITTGSRVYLIVDGRTLDIATICLAGDVNGNGRLDAGDYLALRRAYFKKYNLSGAYATAGDLNASGGIDPMDYALLKKYFHTSSPSHIKGFS